MELVCSTYAGIFKLSGCTFVFVYFLEIRNLFLKVCFCSYRYKRPSLIHQHFCFSLIFRFRSWPSRIPTGMAVDPLSDEMQHSDSLYKTLNMLVSGPEDAEHQPGRDLHHGLLILIQPFWKRYQKLLVRGVGVGMSWVENIL